MKSKLTLALSLGLLLFARSQGAVAGSSNVAVGDINGDGLDDVLIATDDAYMITLATGDGTFASGKWIQLDSENPIEASFVDLAGDGNLAPLVGFSNLGGFEFFVNQTHPFRAYGYGAGLSRIETVSMLGISAVLYASFDASQKGMILEFDPAIKEFVPLDILTYPSESADVQIGPFTTNLDMQLAVLFPSSLVVYDRDTTTGFQSINEFPLMQAYENLDAGTFTGDSIQNLLLWNPGNAEVILIEYVGSSNWKTTYQTLPAAPSVTTAGDVDGDGFADLPSLNNDRDAIVFLHNQSGSSFSPSTYKMPVAFSKNEEVEILCGAFSSTQDGFIVVAPEKKNGPFIFFMPVESGAISLPIISQVPKVPSFLSKYANATVRDPDNPNLIYWSSYFPDWTTGYSLIGNNLVVQREERSAGELTPAGNITAANAKQPSWPTTPDILVNQETDERSLFHLNSPMPVSMLPLRVFPKEGTYPYTIQPILESREDATIHYRKDGESWETYEPGVTQIVFHRDGTLEVYAEYSAYTSAFKTVSYVINQTYDADSDFDGTPDFVEIATNLNPLDGDPDTDDDGWSDLDELIRDSDPSDAESVPLDLDTDSDGNIVGDGWSDFDEAIRQTDALDPESSPAVTGLNVPEAVLPVSVAEISLATSTGTEGSAISAKLLTGYEIASATLDDSPALRAAVDRPLVVGYTDKDDSEIVLLAYVPRKTLDLQIDGDESTTAEKWIEAYATVLESQLFEIRSTVQIDAESTAVALALGLYIERYASSTVPNIIWSASGTLSQSEVDTLEQSVDLDEAASYISANISDTSLPSLVRTYIEWAKSNDIEWNVIKQLAWILHGWPPDGDQPESLSAKTASRQSAAEPATIDYSSVLAELDALLDSIPTREVSLEGTIAWNAEGFPYILQDGIIYGLDSEGSTLTAGESVVIEARTVVPSPYDDVVWVKVNALEILIAQVNENTTDTDGNGLPDQWENFYFAKTADVSAIDDEDGDGFTNKQEYDGYSDPTDASSTPKLDGTPVRDWPIYR